MPLWLYKVARKWWALLFALTAIWSGIEWLIQSLL